MDAGDAGMSGAAVEFNDGPMRELAQFMRRVGNLVVRVGVVGPSASERAGASEMTLAQLATIHEYGSGISPGQPGHVPERSFLRSALAARRGDIAALITAQMKRILSRETDQEGALNAIGAQIAAWIKAPVLEGAGIAPPLKQATIDRKGSSRPLVDTGQLIAHGVTWIVGPAEDA